MIHSSIVQGERNEIVCVIKEEIQLGFRLSSLAVACNTKQITKQLSCFQLAVLLYVKSVMIYVVLASPAQLSLLQEGELHARNMPFFFLSDVSCNKNENRVGVWCCDCVFFFLPFSFVYEYLRKKVGLFSRLLLPVMGLDNGLQLPERTGHPLCLLCISGAQPVYSCYDN